MDTDNSRILDEARILYEKDFPPPEKPTLDVEIDYPKEEPEGDTLEELWLNALAIQLKMGIAEDTARYFSKPEEMKAYDKALREWKKARRKALPDYIEKVCKRDKVSYRTDSF